jgi:CheY-like chemotaxis protein
MKIRKHILILDDDLDSIHFISKILENAGHSVHYATNATDFSQLLNEIGPHLILVDYKLNLGTLTGIHIIDRLKKDEFLRKIPIFLISATESKKLIATATAVGASDFIKKPIQTAIFLQKIKKALKIHELPELTLKEPLKVKCQSMADIIQISESSLKIKGPIKYSDDTVLNIDSPYLQSLGCHTCKYKTNDRNKVLDAGIYINEVEIKGIKEESAKKIRMIKTTTKQT